MNSSLLASVLVGHVGQMMDVVQAEQAAISRQNGALDRQSLQGRLQHALQGLGLGDILRMHGVHDRASLAAAEI